MKKIRLLTGLLFLFSTAPVFMAEVRFTQTDSPRILILNSYNQGLDWTDNITRGITEVLALSYPKAQIDIEYMDTKQVHTPRYLDLLKEFYFYKYTERFIHFDLILCSDNNALSFLVENREELFGEVPTIFCGINDFHKDILKNKPLYTGIGETPLVIRETLDLALRLHDDLKHVFIYAADTPTYRANKAALQKYMPDYQGQLQFHFQEGLRITAIRNHLMSVPEDSIVLILDTVEEDNGERIALEEYPARIVDISPVPLYGSWDYNVGPGALGGCVLSGYHQGKTIAEMAVSILGGRSITEYPPQTEGPRFYKFDYRQLVRFHIEMKRLPPGALVINRPTRMNPEVLKWLIIGALGFMAAIIIILALLWNIFDRHKTLMKLRLSKEKFSKIFQTSPEWLIIFNAEDHRCVEANSAFMEESGLTDDRIIGQRIDALPIWENGEQWQEASRQLHRDGLVKNFRILCRNQENQSVPTLWSIVTIHVAAEEYFLAVSRNISELEQLHSQLNRSQRMESLGTLAGGVAHDFNNLLQGILGNADIMKMKLSRDSPLLDNVIQIKDISLRGSDLVRQLLALGNRAVGSPKTLDLNEEINNTIKIMRRTLPKMTEIRFKAREGLPPLYMDPVQTGQVLMNLIVNADDAMPEGGTISITTDCEELDSDFCDQSYQITPGHFLKLSVQDTGTGISPEDQTRIFDPFFTTKGTGKGTGLGLSTVFHILQSCGGHICCQSTPGAGTTFMVYFPVDRERDTPRGELMEEDAGTGGHESILIADDEDPILKLNGEILKSAGYDVTMVQSGEEVLEKYKNIKDYDLVILDMIMPGMGGRCCMDRLRERDPDARILIASGYNPDWKDWPEEAREAYPFLTKPFRYDELLRSVREALDREPDPSL